MADEDIIMEKLEREYAKRKKELYQQEEQLHQEKRETLRYCDDLFQKVNHYLGSISEDQEYVSTAQNSITLFEEESLIELKSKQKDIDNLLEDNELEFKTAKQKLMEED